MMKKFNYIGMDITRTCDNKEPHAPHVIDEYNTVCHGWLQRFCLGRECPSIRITVTKEWAGDAFYPGYVQGTVEELEGGEE